MKWGALKSFMVLGAALLVIGAGTTAFLTDSEDATDNRMGAGNLDLKVDWNQSYNGEWVNAYPVADDGTGQAPIRSRDDIAQDRFGEDYDQLDSTQQGVVEGDYRDQFADLPDDLDGPLINLTDVKAGDHGEVTFSIHVFGNPAFACIQGRVTENAENGVTEAEADTDAEDDPQGPASGTNQSGELLGAIETEVFYDLDGDNEFDQGEDQVIFTGSMENLTALLSREGGIPLDGNISTAERDRLENSQTKYVALRWRLPHDVGSEIQGDTIQFDIGFCAEQSRHNTPTPVPTLPPQETPTVTPTATPTETPTATPTDTPTATPTKTPYPTPTVTPNATPTKTPYPPKYCKKCHFKKPHYYDGDGYRDCLTCHDHEKPTPTGTPTKPQVSVDVKPGKDLNCINLGNWGDVPVAILGSSSFDVKDIDRSKTRFAGAPALRTAGFDDVNHDGHMDVVFHFETKALDLDSDAKWGELRGKTIYGTKFFGKDSVCTRPPGHDHAPYLPHPKRGDDDGDGYNDSKDGDGYDGDGNDGDGHDGDGNDGDGYDDGKDGDGYGDGKDGDD